MNPFFQQIIINTSYFSSKSNNNKKNKSKYSVAKQIYIFKKVFRAESINYFLIVLGVLSAGFGLKGFLLPNLFIDGGITGVSLLVAQLTGFPLALLIVVLNIPFILLALTQININFAIKTVIGIVLLAICISLINYPIITSDKLLISVFGGIFLGLGIGLAIRGGGVLDGTEILALSLSKKLGLTVGDVILIINIFIFSIAAFILSLESALYSILTYFAATKTVTFIIEGIEEYTGVTIISSKSEEIRLMIIEIMGRGVTIYNGKRGFAKQGIPLSNTDIVYTVVTRLEISKLKIEIEKIDNDAFIIMSSIKDTKGGVIKKRAFKH